MEFSKVITDRRSVRSFKKEKIDEEIVLKILEDALAAPNSCNLQNFSFILLNNKKLLKQLESEASYKFSYAETFVIISMQSDFSTNRGAGYVSAGFIADHLVLSAKNRGFDTLVMAGFKKDKIIKNILKIPRDYEILMLIALGKSDELKTSKPTRVNVQRWVGLNGFNPNNRIRTEKDPKAWSWRDVVDYRMRIGQVYVERFRLNTLPEKAYEVVLENHFSPLISPSRRLKILDFISYDGTWIKLVVEKLLGENSKDVVYASDFIKELLESHKKHLGIRTLKLNDFDPRSLESSFDVVTSVYQLNHFPNVEEQLFFCMKSLNPKGILLLSIFEDTCIKKILKDLLLLMAKMKKKKINVYENNVYYKAGPYTRYNHTKIVKILRRLDSTEPIVTQYTLGKGFRKYRVKVIEVQKKEVAH